MKLSYTKFNALMSAVMEHLNTTDMTIYDISGYGGEPVQFGVNWCAMGTCTVKETKEFAENLRYAASLAETLNRLDIEYVFDDWKFTDRQAYKDYMQNIINALKRGSLHGIKEAISR